MRINFIKYFLILIILSLPAISQSNFEINGYQKYLFTSMKTPVYKNRINDHLLHSRINGKWYISSSLTAGIETRIRSFYGNSIEKIPGFKKQVEGNYDLINLDAELWDSEKSLGYGEIDRFYLDYTLDKTQITLGRQRISWGTSLVWNIVDIFNPKSILDFDYEELPGSDALRFQYYTGPVSRLEAVVNPGKNKFNSSYAALFSYNFKNYDYFIILGVHNYRKVLAGGWSGYIKSSGFRGEFKISEAPSKGKRGKQTDEQLSILLEEPIYEYDKTVFSCVLSWDYTFSNSFYVHSEALYNSSGKTEQTGLFSIQALEANMLSAARINLFQEFSFDITPLLRGSIFGLYNPNDKSAIVVPSITWSVITNLDLTFLGYFNNGKQYTEFGDAGNLLFVRFKYSF